MIKCVVVNLILKKSSNGVITYKPYGEHIPSTSTDGYRNSWVGTPSTSLAEALPANGYITENVNRKLTAPERNIASQRVLGIVPNTYAKKVEKTGTKGMWVLTTDPEFLPPPVITPPAIVAPPVVVDPVIPTPDVSGEGDPVIPGRTITDNSPPLPLQTVVEDGSGMTVALMLAGAVVIYILSRRQR